MGAPFLRTSRAPKRGTLGAPRPRALADARALALACFASCVRLVRSPPALLEPGYPGPGALLVREGVLHHLREVGVAHQLRELPDVTRVGLQEPRPERAPEVVGLYVLL